MKSPNLPEPELAETLSRRVSQLRIMKNLTVLDLAKACRFSIERIEGIESGLEIWLSVTDRTILARALGVLPAVLKEVECNPADLTERRLPGCDLDELAGRVLKGEKDLSCPNCGTKLKCSIERALDFEGLPTSFARAYCPSCPFALR